MSIGTELEHFMEYVFGFCAALDEALAFNVLRPRIRYQGRYQGQGVTWPDCISIPLVERGL